MLSQLFAIFLATYFGSYFVMVCAFMTNSNPGTVTMIGRLTQPPAALKANWGMRCICGCAAALSYYLWTI